MPTSRGKNRWIILSLPVVVKPLCAPVTIMINPWSHRVLRITPSLVLWCRITRSSHALGGNLPLIWARTASSSNAFSILRPYQYAILRLISTPPSLTNLIHLLLKPLSYKTFLITQPLLAPPSRWNNVSMNECPIVSLAALSRSWSYGIAGSLSSAGDYFEYSVNNNKSL